MKPEAGWRRKERGSSEEAGRKERGRKKECGSLRRAELIGFG